jgi:hypothetical protein
MMFDVAAGVLIAAAICAVFGWGINLVVNEGEKSAWWLIWVPLALAAWIVIARWP